MKITKLAKKIKKCKCFCTGTHKNTQIIGTWSALYLMYGLSPMTEQEIRIIMDLGEDKSITYENFDETGRLEHINFADNDTTEVPAYPIGLPLQYGSQTIRCFESEYGLMFVNKDALDPLQDTKGGLNFYVRDSKEGYYLAVKTGMIIIAVVAATSIISDDFVKDLKEFTNKVIFQYNINNAINESTGSV